MTTRKCPYCHTLFVPTPRGGGKTQKREAERLVVHVNGREAARGRVGDPIKVQL